jgi:peptide/nickel transport system permease protein
MIQGIVLFFTVIVIMVNLVVDLAYAWLNPRAVSS